MKNRNLSKILNSNFIILKNEKQLTKKNKYICYYGSRIFPKEDGEEKFIKKISLYKDWYQSNQPEIFLALEKLYSIYFENSKHHHKFINDDTTINLKLEKILSDINNEVNK